MEIAKVGWNSFTWTGLTEDNLRAIQYVAEHCDSDIAYNIAVFLHNYLKNLENPKQ